MCKYCEMKDGELFFDNRKYGKNLLDANAINISLAPDGNYYLTDDQMSIPQLIVACPICGRDLTNGK